MKGFFDQNNLETINMLKEIAVKLANKRGVPDLADDLAQELWLNLPSYEQGYRDDGNLHGYLWVVAKNHLSKMIDRHQKKGVPFEEYVQDIETEEHSHEMEEDLIRKIDKEAALSRVREKLKARKGEVRLSIVESYHEKKRAEKYPRRVYKETENHERLMELLKASGASKERFAKAIGISAQRLHSYLSRKVSKVPDWIIEAAERAVVSSMPEPLSSEQMSAWYQELVQICCPDLKGIKERDIKLAKVLNVSDSTTRRWRMGRTHLMPEKAQKIKQQLIDSYESRRASASDDKV